MLYCAHVALTVQLTHSGVVWNVSIWCSYLVAGLGDFSAKSEMLVLLSSSLPSSSLLSIPLSSPSSLLSYLPDVSTVKDLPVLPSCEFTALYAMRRRIKGYSGIYQVFESRVEPKDETWFTNWKRKDIGNTVIDKKVHI